MTVTCDEVIIEVAARFDRRRRVSSVLLASLLLLGGCAKPKDGPTSVSPRPPLANAMDAGVSPPAPVADATASAAIAEMLNNPNLSSEDKQRILEVLMQPQELHGSDQADAGPASSAAMSGNDLPPDPLSGPDVPNSGGNDVRPPIAADLAEYTKGIAGRGALTATIETSMGALHCKLYADKAPITVANFIGLATGKKPWQNPQTGVTETGKPFYDGLIFHRATPGFGIQGGDPLGVGIGGPGYQFVDEVNNGLKMRPGTLLMANAGPGTNGSQFFITEGSPGHLNDRHTIFGLCKEIDLVKKIGRVPTDSVERPTTPVTIDKNTFSRR
jgi:peptidyl-prolyl cis-trans isomerase A (cyclophilin A)